MVRRRCAQRDKGARRTGRSVEMCIVCFFGRGVLGGGVEVGGIVVELGEVCYVSKARYEVEM